MATYIWVNIGSGYGLKPEYQAITWINADVS